MANFWHDSAINIHCWQQMSRRNLSAAGLRFKSWFVGLVVKICCFNPFLKEECIPKRPIFLLFSLAFCSFVGGWFFFSSPLPRIWDVGGGVLLFFLLPPPILHFHNSDSTGLEEEPLHRKPLGWNFFSNFSSSPSDDHPLSSQTFIYVQLHPVVLGIPCGLAIFLFFVLGWESRSWANKSWQRLSSFVVSKSKFVNLDTVGLESGRSPKWNQIQTIEEFFSNYKQEAHWRSFTPEFSYFAAFALWIHSMLFSHSLIA